MVDTSQVSIGDCFSVSVFMIISVIGGVCYALV